jgi:hypothetical protein
MVFVTSRSVICKHSGGFIRWTYIIWLYCEHKTISYHGQPRQTETCCSMLLVDAAEESVSCKASTAHRRTGQRKHRSTQHGSHNSRNPFHVGCWVCRIRTRRSREEHAGWTVLTTNESTGRQARNQRRIGGRIAKAPRALHRTRWGLPGPHMAAATDWSRAASTTTRPAAALSPQRQRPRELWTFEPALSKKKKKNLRLVGWLRRPESQGQHGTMRQASYILTRGPWIPGPTR